MNKKPKCPKCGLSEFECGFVSIRPDDEFYDVWNPIFCKECGTIVGQLPSGEEREMLSNIMKLSDIEEHLSAIKHCLFQLEKYFSEK